MPRSSEDPFLWHALVFGSWSQCPIVCLSVPAAVINALEPWVPCTFLQLSWKVGPSGPWPLLQGTALWCPGSVLSHLNLERLHTLYLFWLHPLAGQDCGVCWGRDIGADITTFFFFRAQIHLSGSRIFSSPSLPTVPKLCLHYTKMHPISTSRMETIMLLFHYS